jgi:hypothetical protein
MNEILSRTMNPILLVFPVSTVPAAGMSLTHVQIFGPFRNVRLAISAPVASYILVPQTVVFISGYIGLE